MAGDVKRAYRSEARAASAEATRARIRDAAARLFVERGYIATTMREVATAAGVGERTLYDAFPSKPTLFTHTLNVATVGDEEPVRVFDRPEMATAREQIDPRAAIAQLIAYTKDLLERAGDLIMVSVEAAGADPEMKAAAEAGAEATYRVHLALTTALHKRGALRNGLDPVTAADTLYALASPHLHQLLRRHRRWSVERYNDWLENNATRELLG
jgi:AcrR family transcriptional regulator